MYIKKLLIQFGILTIIVWPTASAYGETPPGLVLTPEQQDALAILPLSFDEPPPVHLTARLRPPVTYFNINFKNPAASRAMVENIIQSGGWKNLHLALFDMYLEDIVWDGGISCGIWDYSAIGVRNENMNWYHPNGAPPTECPHDQGTDHPGIIRVRGAFDIHAMYDDQTSPHHGTILFEKRWKFTCTHDGSGAGEVPCEVTQDSVTSIQNPGTVTEDMPSDSQDDVIPHVLKATSYRKLSVITAGTAMALLGGGVYYFFRRRIGR